MMMLSMMEIILLFIHRSPKPNPDGRDSNSHYEKIYYEYSCPNRI